MTATVPDVPPFVVAQDLISKATQRNSKNPWREAECAAWEQQLRYGGKSSEAGPFWAAVAGAVDDEYRKHQRGDRGDRQPQPMTWSGQAPAVRIT